MYFRDHNGNDFRSIAKMCNYYDIDKKVFKSRMDNGWTLKDALTLTDRKPITKKPEIDLLNDAKLELHLRFFFLSKKKETPTSGISFFTK